ncbi:MAG TPA: carboxypeptidase regulatory-like domain-containing protein [Terracidiphilus sp.]|nr:carboxypeptidase regulatory-like domain-containing protein [Terracidiphilus sp.]
MQKARFTVLYDGKPSPNTKVEVTQPGRAGYIAVLTTYNDGKFILPALSPGRYTISAAHANYSSRNSLDVCIVPCDDYRLEVVHFVPTTLHGPLRVLDANALALSEVRMEISPRPDPVLGHLLADAEQQPITKHLAAFRGVVKDQSGAVIPGAWINVVVKGSGGKNRAASMYADQDGQFSAQLPPGEYVAFIQSPGFKSSVVSFTIANEAAADSLEIVLDIGMQTTTVTLSAAQMQPRAVP